MADSKRQAMELKDGWRFIKGDPAGAMDATFDDSDWSQVRVPHDWAISGAFDHETDVQVDHEGKPHIGRTAGLPHIGTAWYRLAVDVPSDWAGKRIYIEFDGAMSHSRVYVNGHEVGYRPYGYISFFYDITRYVQPGASNLLAVRLENKPRASRWYPGAGLYRNVRFIAVEPVHVKPWGVYITTPNVTVDAASLRVRTEVVNGLETPARVNVKVCVHAPSGECVATLQDDVELPAGSDGTVDMAGELASPALWSPEEPNLYRAVTEIYKDGALVDILVTRFGVRTVRMDAVNGFELNGKRMKLRGVCLHHDLGALGAAVNRRAIERQLELLRGMGCNAIRTAHNPAAPELLDLCDEMGFMVIEESFDEWRVGKVENGYHTLFDAWAERDLRDMIRRDRNHPCIIMWSIGNEMLDQRIPEGGQTAKFLRDICHDEDPTRPVTAGVSLPDEAFENGLVHALDVVGWNYQHHRYGEFKKAHPELIMFGSETESCVSSRGAFYLPVQDARDVKRASLHASDYGVEAPPWGYPPEYELLAQEDPSLLGQFTWTGFDYLGEPTPYDGDWPARSSYFGIFDLCGFPKSRYFLYKSAWTDEPTLHVFPHWNWEGHAGQLIPVHCYTNFPAAELFVNGKSYGVQWRELGSGEAGAGEEAGALGEVGAGDGGVGEESEPGRGDEGVGEESEPGRGDEGVGEGDESGRGDEGVGEGDSNSGQGQEAPAHGQGQEESAHGQGDSVDTRGELGSPFNRYRLMWQVPYEPGVVEVVALDSQGNPAMRSSVHTAGVPARLEMVPDRKTIGADGDDLCFVTVRVTDAAGHLCPTAENRIRFTVEGPATIAAVDNGDPTSLEPFIASHRRAFGGKALLVLRSQPGKSGRVRVTARSDGLEEAQLEIDTVEPPKDH